ncbi:unnamed protein product [Periconia digitata]|uniref:Major facilitator superfamily (MFS) profile domain-containing protein n=1 Tax=Periconia digitata TaxID=1303443 RepID=A0A9W4U5W4_9PLEO|nr:unnamed protein product [Periconia digitata]
MTGFDSTTLITKKPAAVHHATPPRSPEPAGAAQFINNLNERQQAHLQFAIPATAEPERFSQFLEGPRKTRVPDRFTFDALDSESRSLRESTKSPVLDGKEQSKPSKSNLNNVTSANGKDDYDGKSNKSLRSGKRSRASSFSKRASVKSGSTKTYDADFPKTPISMQSGWDRGVDWRFYVVATCLLLINIVVAWDIVVITIALPAISFSLHGSAVQTYWVALAFLVAATVFLPLFSAFADIFGRKPTLISGLVLFTAGSLIAGVSGSMEVLQFGRLIQGVGAGGIYSLSDLIASDLVSPLDKRRLNTALGAVWAFGAVTGPAIGEALAKNDRWRWIFWINLPFCVVGSVVLFIVARLRGPTSGSIGPKLRKFDWFGFILLGASITAFFLGLSWGGSLYSWTHTSTLLPLQFGVVGFAVYGIWVWFSPFTPVISMEGFMDRTIIGAFIGTMFQGVVLGALLYFMPFFFTVAKLDLASLPVGVRWLPWTLPFIICVTVTFIVVSRWNLWLLAIWIGWALTTLGISLTVLFTRTVPNVGWVCIAIVTGAGLGVLYPSLHTAAELIAAQDINKARRAITNYSFFHFLGKAFGVAMGLSIFENELLKNLKANPTFEDFATRYTNDAVATVAKIQKTEGLVQVQIMDIYVQSLRTVWMVLAGISGLALILSIFIKPRESKTAATTYREVEMDGTYAV